MFISKQVEPWGLVSEASIPLGVYTHIAASFDGRQSRIFLNGTLQATQTEGPQPPDTSSPLILGAILDSDVPAKFFHGEMDEVRVWSLCRTPGELAAFLSKRLSGKEQVGPFLWMMIVSKRRRGGERNLKKPGVMPHINCCS